MKNKNMYITTKTCVSFNNGLLNDVITFDLSDEQPFNITYNQLLDSAKKGLVRLKLYVEEGGYMNGIWLITYSLMKLFYDRDNHVYSALFLVTDRGFYPYLHITRFDFDNPASNDFRIINYSFNGEARAANE